PEEGQVASIDSSTFLGKSKAALAYYSTSIFGTNNQLNAFYTIGEEATNFYVHNPGQIAQRNNAHFLELASAIAIVEFTKSLNNFQSINGRATSTVYNEFGVNDPNSRKLNFKSLGSDTQAIIQKPLSKMFLMTKLNDFVKKNKTDFIKSPWYIELNEVYSNNGLYNTHIEKFEEHFKEWFNEMHDNDISFKPFNSNVEYQDLLNIVEGYSVRGPLWKFWENGTHGDKFNHKLNSEFKKLKRSDDKERNFLTLFHKATESQIKSILN
nr:hypothetical protein [Flavobacteriales bacterium]